MFRLVHPHIYWLLFSKLLLNKLHSPLFCVSVSRTSDKGIRTCKQIICSVEIDDNIIQKYDSCSNCERKMWNSIQSTIVRYKWAGKRAKVKLTHWYRGLKKIEPLVLPLIASSRTVRIAVQNCRYGQKIETRL